MWTWLCFQRPTVLSYFKSKASKQLILPCFNNTQKAYPKLKVKIYADPKKLQYAFLSEKQQHWQANPFNCFPCPFKGYNKNRIKHNWVTIYIKCNKIPGECVFTVASLRLCSYDPLLTPAKQWKSPEHPHTLDQPADKTQVHTCWAQLTNFRA